MTEVIQTFAFNIIEIYKNLMNNFPPILANFINFLILVFLIVVYVIFVWNGYKYISKKDPLGLNLKQYKNYEIRILDRIFTGFVFFLEYLIIIPFIIFITFVFLSFFLILISSSTDTNQIILLSSIIIATIRIISYYREQLAEEIAKMLPFAILIVFISNPSSLADVSYLERIVNHFLSIPSFFWQILNYLIFIILLESVLRFLDYAYSIINPEQETSEDEEENKEEK